MCEHGEGVGSVVYEVSKNESEERELLKVVKINKIKKENVNKYVQNIEEIDKLNNKYLIKYDVMNVDSECILLLMKKYSNNLSVILSCEEAVCSIDSYKVMKDICEGIKALHDQSQIHGNIKPTNVLYDDKYENEEENYILSDYCENDLFNGNVNGIAITMTNIEYMSPEMLLSKEMGKESDIYSIGVILNEIKRGRKAFGGDNIVEIINRKLRNEYERIENDFSEEFDLLFSKLLTIEPSKRISIDELLEELKSI